MKKRVVVAMSGGVDSSVAAALLKEQGYEVIGVTMQLWPGRNFSAEEENIPVCCSFGDVVADAKNVAAQLDIPLHSINCVADFQQQVIAPFCDEYFFGRTPNPCVICNKKLKFGRLLEKAFELGADYLATGHYVSLEQSRGCFYLHKGFDRIKDQSYFLFALTQQQLSHSLFPLGGLSKQQVREHAMRLNLQAVEKSESQDICFIPDGDYVNFLEKERGVGKLNGEIVHVSGKVLGQHQGIYHYTIGQRKGLGIGWNEALYVIKIAAAEKQVIVGEKQHLSRTEFLVAGCNWSIPQPTKTFSAACRIRYRHTEMPAKVEPLIDDRVKVIFASPQKGITPGQAAVFYVDDLVIGGGWIQ